MPETPAAEEGQGGDFRLGEQEFAQEIYEDKDDRRKWLEARQDVKRELENRRRQLGWTRSMLKRLPRGS